MSGLASLESLLAEAAQEGVFAGAVARVGIGAELLWEAAAGRASLVPEIRPLTLGTLFDVASVTKVAATASAACLLAGRGDLELDDPVGRYLEDWQADKSSVTIRHLLSHTSGLPGWKAYGRMWLEEHRLEGHAARPSEASREWMLKSVIEDDLFFPPGSSFLYSDPGFIVLWEALERVAGEPLGEFLARELFGPLGMEKTFFAELTTPRSRPDHEGDVAPTEDCPIRGRMLLGEVHDLNAWALGGVSGHAGLFSSAGDLHKLGAAWLAAINGETKGPLEPSSAVEFFRLQRPELESPFALGWDSPRAEGSLAGKLLGPEARGHWGYTGCSLWVEPVRGLIVVLLTNRVPPNDTPPDAMKAFRPAFHDAVVAAVEKALR